MNNGSQVSRASVGRVGGVQIKQLMNLAIARTFLHRQLPGLGNCPLHLQSSFLHNGSQKSEMRRALREKHLGNPGVSWPACTHSTPTHWECAVIKHPAYAGKSGHPSCLKTSWWRSPAQQGPTSTTGAAFARSARRLGGPGLCLRAEPNPVEVEGRCLGTEGSSGTDQTLKLKFGGIAPGTAMSPPQDWCSPSRLWQTTSP